METHSPSPEPESGGSRSDNAANSIWDVLNPEQKGQRPTAPEPPTPETSTQPEAVDQPTAFAIGEQVIFGGGAWFVAQDQGLEPGMVVLGRKTPDGTHENTLVSIRDVRRLGPAPAPAISAEAPTPPPDASTPPISGSISDALRG